MTVTKEDMMRFYKTAKPTKKKSAPKKKAKPVRKKGKK